MIAVYHKDNATIIVRVLVISNNPYSESVTGPELDAMDDEK